MNQDLGSYLRTLRERRHLSQKRLAARAGMVSSHISRVEHGQRGLSFVSATALGDALELAGDELDTFLLRAGFAPLSEDAAALVVAAQRAPVLTELAAILADAPLGARERGLVVALLAAVADYARTGVNYPSADAELPDAEERG